MLAKGSRILNLFQYYTFLTYIFNYKDVVSLSVDVSLESKPHAGSNISLMCKTESLSNTKWWVFGDENVTATDRISFDRGESDYYSYLRLNISHLTFDHQGKYTCFAAEGEDIATGSLAFNVTVPGKVVSTSNAHANVTSPASLSCTLEGYPLTNVSWERANVTFVGDDEQEKFNFTVGKLSETKLETSLEFPKLKPRDNGSYLCQAIGVDGPVVGVANLYVLDVPHIYIDVVKVVGARRIFLNWTLNDGNEPVQEYFVKTFANGSNEWTFYPEKIPGGNTSYIIQNLQPNTEYKIKLMAKNAIGRGIEQDTPDFYKTFDKDSDFTPEVSLKAITPNAINIGWSSPPKELTDHVHYYILLMYNNSTKKETVQSANQSNLYMFRDLHSATNYKFKVAACSEYTHQCGSWSKEIDGTTMDGVAGAPENLTVVCKYDTISRSSFIVITWEPPSQPNGVIIHYNVVLEGSSVFLGDKGVWEKNTIRPLIKSVDKNSTRSVRFDLLPANTNYSVKVSGVTRIRGAGKDAEAVCTMPPTIPDKEKLNQANWSAVKDQDRWLMKLSIPRVSERNGPICCYRVFVIKLEPNQTVNDLPPPEETKVSSYQEVHMSPKGGTYIADMFESNALSNDIYLGDNVTLSEATRNSKCKVCVGLRPSPPTTPPAPPTSPTNGGGNSSGAPIIPAEIPSLMLETPRAKRDDVLTSTLKTTGVTVPSVAVSTPPTPTVYDGLLDINSNYSGFIEVIVLGGNDSVIPAYSAYFVAIKPGPHNLPLSPTSVEILTFILQQLVNEHFPDRSTKASEARENQHKNRYPDIKSYDQTRVRLTPVDGVPGSDYINANFVLGYKELKKFICAQGPMEITVNDFWRMIWEQHLEIVIMLTNLEEYSKIKCAKYWPEQEEGDKTYGDFIVGTVNEKKFGEYILRELKLVRTASGKENEERSIFQYHYLAWKDFQAPENPSGLLKFIKHVNEAYSLEKGPILVHCSAGVGRTGTLVALDSLLQQLRAEGQVSVFNTVCDLRRQRNFLVQSLKQYIFIYRALVEVVQFGETEIRASDLKTTLETLKRINDGNKKSELELEFDRLSQAKEENKSTSNAKTDENKDKNREETVVPYDRNRVILSPAKDYSNYINASFIEAYDNTESFIITQDPDMEHTVHDFWRMVSEHSISTIIMLSDFGDSPKKCPRYWPDDEIKYDNIGVKYIQSESCPYFTRRELSVCNTKCNSTIPVIQYQYNGWPTVEGEVPEVTRGFIELIDHTQPNLANPTPNPPGSPTPSASSPGPLLVHCHAGSERSSMFVALSILVQQLTLEKRVDVFSVVRKLRTQRLGMIQTFAQYEFLYRAILNYAELHKINCDGV
uniref:protein-tyrosine-phosphatase n=1 Tax=Cacopsylla melanoneura TaxID=428564 RepID=A0A8D9BTY0_9HEMI